MRVVLRSARWPSVWRVPVGECGCCELGWGHIAVGWCVVVGEWGRGSRVVGVKYSCWLSAYRCKMAWVLGVCVGSQVS